MSRSGHKPSRMAKLSPRHAVQPLEQFCAQRFHDVDGSGAGPADMERRVSLGSLGLGLLQASESAASPNVASSKVQRSRTTG
jgi:hypothetical protein